MLIDAAETENFKLRPEYSNDSASNEIMITSQFHFHLASCKSKGIAPKSLKKVIELLYLSDGAYLSYIDKLFDCWSLKHGHIPLSGYIYSPVILQTSK